MASTVKTIQRCKLCFKLRFLFNIFGWYFQEYIEALGKLRDAYFHDGIHGDAIPRQNINVMSDMYFGDSILHALVLQTKVNRKDTDKTTHKDVFLFRW